MKKLLIVTKSQFGYHIDPYKYAYYLKDDYEITHICWEFELPKVHVEGIRVKYITREGNKIERYTRFIREINQEIKSQPFDIIFMVFFPGATLLKILNPNRVFNIDIRTAADTKNKMINLLRDTLLKWECKQFHHLSILSHGLAKKLGFEKYHYLPLGGEQFSSNDKNFKEARFLYVGTLENRNLITLVKGFHRFLQIQAPDGPSASLTIIGDGPGNELEEIRNYIRENQIENHIITTGYVQNDSLYGYFEHANIGVSFVPMTPYYDHQPPTKTYEYLLSGLPVLATATTENSKIINDTCGVLIRDNEEAVVAGLLEIVKRLKDFDSATIRNLYSDSAWINISKYNLQPYLESLSPQADFSLQA